jgi:hypothetical protein
MDDGQTDDVESDDCQPSPMATNLRPVNYSCGFVVNATMCQGSVDNRVAAHTDFVTRDHFSHCL